MKKNPNITEKTKAKIVKTFIKLCLDKNPHKITITQIVQKAKYNRSTFYEYFNDLDDLYEQVEKELLERANILALTNHENLLLGKEIVLSKTQYKTIALHITALLRYNRNPNFITQIKNSMKSSICKTYNIDITDYKTNYALEFAINGMIGTYLYWANNGCDLEIKELKPVIFPFINVLKEQLLNSSTPK